MKDWILPLISLALVLIFFAGYVVGAFDFHVFQLQHPSAPFWTFFF